MSLLGTPFRCRNRKLSMRSPSPPSSISSQLTDSLLKPFILNILRASRVRLRETGCSFSPSNLRLAIKPPTKKQPRPVNLTHRRQAVMVIDLRALGTKQIDFGVLPYQFGGIQIQT